jgi:zinc/manganese transport system substrate-binding protein
MMRFMIAALMLLLSAAPAAAQIKVVATLPFIGSLAQEIGGDRIEVVTLVKPGQDAHYAEARPSMILAARKADILMYNGLDLEIGYLPRIMESSGNPNIQPGAAGNFDCSRFVSVIEKQAGVDRSMGDVHPMGNPHYVFSPKNIASVASGMSRALSEADPANAGYYKHNFKQFRQKLAKKQKEWRKKTLRGKTFVAYHKYFEYLASEYGFRIIAYIEPKPGISPSAGHISALLDLMKRRKPSAVLATYSSGAKEAEYVGQAAGIRTILLPNDVGAAATAGDWFSLMDTVMNSL